MSWDYFAYIAENPGLREETSLREGLVGGFADEVSVRFFTGDKIGARNRYMRRVHGDVQIPQILSISTPNFATMPSSQWLGLQVDFELLTPWYSKDDRLFHVMDNPVRKDRVFGVPFMSASSWKGMLRWACRMQAGLREHLEKHGSKLNGWKDPAWILYLFGNEKGEEEHFRQGALVFYPTWFNKIGFEVINPHRRATRAGTQPIYYEVVPGKRVIKNRDGNSEEIEGAKGVLSLLYAPWPGMKPAANPREVLPELLEAIESLLITYGISAKRTVGWGTAKIIQWHAYHKNYGSADADSREALWNQINSWFAGGGAS